MTALASAVTAEATYIQRSLDAVEGYPAQAFRAQQV